MVEKIKICFLIILIFILYFICINKKEYYDESIFIPMDKYISVSTNIFNNTTDDPYTLYKKNNYKTLYNVFKDNMNNHITDQYSLRVSKLYNDLSRDDKANKFNIDDNNIINNKTLYIFYNKMSYYINKVIDFFKAYKRRYYTLPNRLQQILNKLNNIRTILRIYLIRFVSK